MKNVACECEYALCAFCVSRFHCIVEFSILSENGSFLLLTMVLRFVPLYLYYSLGNKDKRQPPNEIEGEIFQT